MFNWLRSKQNKEIQEQRAIIDSLNHSLSHAHQAAKNEYHEKLIWLGAFAMQAGGTVELPAEFIEALQKSNYTVNINHDNTTNSYTIHLSSGPEAAK